MWVNGIYFGGVCVIILYIYINSVTANEHHLGMRGGGGMKAEHPVGELIAELICPVQG